MEYDTTKTMSIQEKVTDLLQGSRNEKIRRDSKNTVIQRLFESGFEISSRKGATKINSKMLQQALWKTMSRMKPLDFTVHGTGVPQWKERLVTDAIATILDRGRYISSLRDKEGLFMKSLMWGDGWMQVGANPIETLKTPILFSPISNSNIYFDSYATMMRGAYGRSVTKCCVIYSYSWETAVKLYPKIKKVAAPGRIARDLTYLREIERTWLQTTEIKGSDLIEVGYYYDLDSKEYAIVAGPGLGIVQHLKGDKYPFIIDDEAYIPVINQMGMPSSEGIYNHGVFDMIYDLALISAQLMNMAVGHAEDNVYPITLINAPQKEASKFMNRLRVAHEMRQAGKKGYVVNEWNATTPAGAYTAQSLTTQSLWQEWQSLEETFTRECARLGINLDEIDRGANVSATQVLAEEESANAYVKQLMEYNASEAKIAIEVTIDMIKEFVPKNDKTPLNLTTKYEVDGTEIRPDNLTLGAVADELRKNNYFVKVNARSGTVPSNVFRQAQLSRLMPFAQPGTPAYFKLVEQLRDGEVFLLGEVFYP